MDRAGAVPRPGEGEARPGTVLPGAVSLAKRKELRQASAYTRLKKTQVQAWLDGSEERRAAAAAAAAEGAAEKAAAGVAAVEVPCAATMALMPSCSPSCSERTLPCDNGRRRHVDAAPAVWARPSGPNGTSGSRCRLAGRLRLGDARRLPRPRPTELALPVNIPLSSARREQCAGHYAVVANLSRDAFQAGLGSSPRRYPIPYSLLRATRSVYR